VQELSSSHQWQGAKLFTLTTHPIQRQELINNLENNEAGALVSFEGWVRDHNQGKKVSSLEYQVYPELAQKEGEKILREALEKFNIHSVTCSHRFGHLRLGEIAIWVGAVASHRDDAFKASRYVIDEIKLRLPVWKKEHYLNQKPEWVFCRDHHTHVHFHEEDYYEKQKLITKQTALKSSKVAVIGAGGLGCPVLTSLAAAGVGEITVYDDDRISIGNIHRQHLYSPDVVGEKKVSVAVPKLTLLNPFIKISGIPERVTAMNVEAIFAGMDLVIDCTDNLGTKHLLHDAAFITKVPLISASIYQFEGQIRTFEPNNDSGCLRCATDSLPEEDIGNCNDFGVLGSAVNAIGAIQATEALLYLQNKKNNTTSSTFYIDLRTLQQMRIKNLKKDDCLSCRGELKLQSSGLEIGLEAARLMNAVFVDVRQEDDGILEGFMASKRPVVVFCHRGVRSKKLVALARGKGAQHFYSLTGGACSYSP
jgi:adenylyltransferase/sulfurtransferase